MNTRFHGLMAAVHTPMHMDGSLDLEHVPGMVDRLACDCVTGIFVCGTTGEGPSLTTQERMAVAKAYADAARGRLPVVVHVGHNSLQEARRLAEHAQSIGAAAMAACPPSFLKPPDIETLLACCAEIAGAAPGLPFYYYHIPSLSGVQIGVADLLELACVRLPAMNGVKFTFENLADYQRCLKIAGGRYDCLFGRDEMLLSGLAVGAVGAIGSTYNYAAPLYRRLWDSFNKGDLAAARLLQGKAVDMVCVLQAFGGLAAGKAICGLIGVDMGPTRLPLKPLSPAEIRRLQSELETIGFFDWGR